MGEPYPATMGTITPTPNGPLKVQATQLTDAEGNPVDAPNTMFLCRCGHSDKKPFCDGHHTKVGFKG